MMSAEITDAKLDDLGKRADFAEKWRGSGRTTPSPWDEVLLSIEDTRGLIAAYRESQAEVRRLRLEVNRLAGLAHGLDPRTELKVKEQQCAACHGDGVVPRGFGYTPCEACNGKGF